MPRIIQQFRSGLKRALCSFALVCGVTVGSQPAAAQCGATWITSPSDQPGVSGGAVLAHAVLPNGDIVVGGEFTFAGNTPANFIARWDGTRWSPLGSGMNGPVRTLAVLANGDLLAGGTFTTAGGQFTPARLARWNGSTWSVYGAPCGGLVTAVNDIAALPDGGFVIGGAFSSGPCRNIARWDGTFWRELATGSSTSVPAVAVRPDPSSPLGYNIIAVGNFSGGGPRLHAWNSVNWEPIASDLNWDTEDLLVRPDGRVLALSPTQSTVFQTNCGDCSWNSISWNAYLSVSGVLMSMAVRSDGALFVSGYSFTLGGNILRWNGSGWSQIGQGVWGIASKLTATPSGGILVGGTFSFVGSGIRALNIARVDGDTWSAFNAGFNQATSSGAVLPDGSLAVGGFFTSIGGLSANRVVRWDGSEWSALGSGMNNSVNAIASVPGGVVAGGSFSTAGGVAANRIARWNGSAWLPMGSGMDNTVRAATALFPSGDIVAGGSFTVAGGVGANRIARWNGTAWLPFGSGLDGTVYAVAQLANGDLVAAGDFATAGGAKCRRVARWNGSVWTPLGSGLDATVYALLPLPGGNLLAGGLPSTPSGGATSSVWLWNGSSWSPLGAGLTGSVRSLALTPNPASPNGYDVFVGGSQLAWSGAAPSDVVRWNGTSWSAIGAENTGSVTGIVPLESGELVFLGGIRGGGGLPASDMARYSLTGTPWVSRRPVEQTVSSGATLTLSATCAFGYDFNGPVQFEWRRDGAPIANGAGGASPGGGTVSGASGTLSRYGLTATLVITNARPSDAGAYALTFSNSCGSADSGEVEIVVDASCPADISGDGLVDGADLTILLTSWGLRGPADLDDDGVVNSSDLAMILASWGSCS